jgi:hypothetical protein
MLKKRYNNLEPEGDDVGDRFNSPNNHYHYGLGTIAKLAIGAGLVGTGAGIGAGVPLVIDALKPQPGETRTIEKVIDRDWKVGKPIAVE